MPISPTASMSNSLILSVAVILLGFVILLIRIYHHVRALETKVNEHLRTVGFHWQFFKLYQIPQTLAERTAFYFKMGIRKGQPEGYFADLLTFSIISTEILFRWIFYPRTKKEALQILADSEALSNDQIRLLANRLQ